MHIHHLCYHVNFINVKHIYCTVFVNTIFSFNSKMSECAVFVIKSSFRCFGHALRGLRISSNTLVLGSIGGGCSIVVSSLMSGFLFHRVVGLLAPPSNFPNATSTRGFLSDIKSFYWDKRETMEHSYSSFIFGDSLASIGSWFQFSSKQMLSSTTSQHNRLLDNRIHFVIILLGFSTCLFYTRFFLTI